VELQTDCDWDGLQVTITNYTGNSFGITINKLMQGANYVSSDNLLIGACS